MRKIESDCFTDPQISGKYPGNWKYDRTGNRTTVAAFFLFFLINEHVNQTSDCSFKNSTTHRREGPVSKQPRTQGPILRYQRHTAGPESYGVFWKRLRIRVRPAHWDINIPQWSSQFPVERSKFCVPASRGKTLRTRNGLFNLSFRPPMFKQDSGVCNFS